MSKTDFLISGSLLHDGKDRLLKIYIFIFRVFSCGMWGLVPCPGLESWTLALGAQSQPLDCQGSAGKDRY